MSKGDLEKKDRQESKDKNERNGRSSKHSRSDSKGLRKSHRKRQPLQKIPAQRRKGCIVDEQQGTKKHEVNAAALSQSCETKPADQKKKPLMVLKPVVAKEHSRFARLVKTTAFEGGTAVLAFADCVLLALLMDCEAKIAVFDPNVELECSQDRVSFFKVFNIIMLVIWTVEFFLRVCAGKKQVFKDTGFLLNSMLTWLFGWLLVVIDELAGPDNKTFWLSSFRVLRITHVMRSVKLVGRNQFLKEVWLLIRGFYASMRTLVCSALLLSITIYVFAVIGTSLIGHSNKSDWKDQESLLRSERFDSLFTSILTLIRLLFADDSFDIIEAVCKEWPQSNLYFFTFIGIAVFVVSNLIVAVIVEHALSITASDEENVAHEKIQEKRKLMGRLADIFQQLDREGSGVVTFEEFINSFHIEEMKYMLQSLDFDEKDLIDLFKTLDDDNAGCLNLDEFLVRMGRLSEEPSAKDFLSLMKLAQSCVDLAKLVAADQQGNMPAAVSDASGFITGTKMAQLSGEVTLLNSQLKTLKPKWIARMSHYKGSGS